MKPRTSVRREPNRPRPLAALARIDRALDACERIVNAKPPRRDAVADALARIERKVDLLLGAIGVEVLGADANKRDSEAAE